MTAKIFNWFYIDESCYLYSFVDSFKLNSLTLIFIRYTYEMIKIIS